VAVVAVLGAIFSVGTSREARANGSGTWCYTHECAGTPARDDGAPDLIHDGDNDADDAAVVTPPPATGITHVVTIMEENHSISEITSSTMPYLTSLGDTYAKAIALQAITHPSLPNYFAITSGSTQGAGSDCGSSTAGCTTPADNIFHQLESGAGWNQWSDAMPSNCDSSNATSYVVHHAIPPFYTDLATCQVNDVALDQNTVPPITAGYTFITPSNDHNAHSGSLTLADQWLKTVVGQLMIDPAYTNGSTLIEITFDEGSGGNNTVLTTFIHPTLSGVVITQPTTHYSTLRLNEELLGLPLLGAAQTAPDIRQALGL
jgi:phosphatidylinositol-3-phosphatase